MFDTVLNALSYIALLVAGVLLLMLPELISKFLDRKRTKKSVTSYNVVIQGLTISYQDLERTLRYTFQSQETINNVQLVDLHILNCPKDIELGEIYNSDLFPKKMRGCR